MIGVITGDIIKSRSQQEPEIWLEVLKGALAHCAPSKQWEIFRGDSFQLELNNIDQALFTTIYIKACIKTIRTLDVRMAIGIGEKTFQGKNVMESSGEAFLYSGETLEQLKKEKTNLKIKSNNPVFNQEMNIYLKLALTIMDAWTTNSAEIVKLYLEHPQALQEELGKELGINQNAVSNRLKRSQLDIILKMEQLYREKIKVL